MGDRFKEFLAHWNGVASLRTRNHLSALYGASNRKIWHIASLTWREYIKRMGRPTDYTKELGDEICVRVAEDEGVAAICRDEAMPSRTTIYKWLREHSEFANNYARARLDQGHTAADEMREVRRKVEAGTLEPGAARVVMDALKWEAGKRNPKSYGEKVALIGGDADDAPIRMVQRRIIDSTLDAG